MNHAERHGDLIDWIIENSPDIIEGAFKLIEWAIVVAALRFGAAAFPAASTEHRILSAISEIGQYAIFAWLLSSLYKSFPSEFDGERRRSLILLVALIIGAFIITWAESALIGIVVRAPSTKEAH